MKKNLKNVILLLFLPLLLASCGKSETQTSELKSTNLVFNGNFEMGITTPDGWHTYNQFLNDVTGWVTNEAYAGKHSLKIENIGGSEAYWIGNPTKVTSPANELNISVVSLAKSIKGNGSYQARLTVVLENNKQEEAFIDLSDKTNAKIVGKRFVFPFNIKEIIPRLIFSGYLGEVYFNSFRVESKYADWDSGKVLFDSNNDKLSGGYSEDEYKSTTYKGHSGFYTKLISIDAKKLYKLSGEFESKGNQQSILYFGVTPYSADRKPIKTAIPVDGSSTILVRECRNNDTSIIVKDAGSWIPLEDAQMTFTPNSSDENKELVRSFNGIAKVEKYGDFWEIFLKNPIEKDFPAGTKISEQNLSIEYIWGGALKVNVPNELTLYGAVFGGESLDVYPKLSPGIKYVQIIFYANYGQNENARLTAKNIKFIEL